METRELEMSGKQRRELEALVTPSTQILRAALFFAFVALVGGCLRRVQQEVIDAPPLWIVMTAVIALVVYLRSGRWTGGPALRRRIREDLDTGIVRSTIIEPDSVTEIEEQEDEGPGFVIETRGGETVLLTGQELEPLKRRRFPWSRFEILDAPCSGHHFGIRKIGEPVPVDRTIAPLTYQQAKSLGVFARSFIVLDDDAKRILSDPQDSG